MKVSKLSLKITYKDNMRVGQEQLAEIRLFFERMKKR